MKSKVFPCIVFVVLGVIFGGGEGFSSESKALVKGADVELREHDIDRVLSLLPSDAALEVLKDDTKFEEVIFSTYRVMVLAEEGEKLAEEDDQVKAKLWHAEKNMLAEIYIDRVISAALEESALREAAKEYYDSHKKQFKLQKKYNISHIQFDKQDGEKAKLVFAELKEGKIDFDAAAESYSIDLTSKRSGGKLGWVKKGEIVAPVYDAIREAGSEGGVFGPVESEFGWHIVKVLETQDARILFYEESEEDIIKFLKKERRSQITEGLMAKTNAEIQDINRQEILEYRRRKLAAE